VGVVRSSRCLPKVARRHASHGGNRRDGVGRRSSVLANGKGTGVSREAGGAVFSTPSGRRYGNTAIPANAVAGEYVTRRIGSESALGRCWRRAVMRGAAGVARRHGRRYRWWNPEYKPSVGREGDETEGRVMPRQTNSTSNATPGNPVWGGGVGWGGRVCPPSFAPGQVVPSARASRPGQEWAAVRVRTKAR